MTQIFKADGDVIPVTAVLIDPNVVVGIKIEDRDGYSAIQLGMGKTKNVKKPQKGLMAVETIKEFRINKSEIEKVKIGDVISADTFTVGDKVKVAGTSKGKGFQGVVKRHGFHGSPASHGHKDQERMPGSIGATDAARVFKGVRMPGQMGDAQVTVTGLEVAEVNMEKNIIYIKGALPGARNGLLMISGPGEIVLKHEDIKPANHEIIKEKEVTDKPNNEKQAINEKPRSDNDKKESSVKT